MSTQTQDAAVIVDAADVIVARGTQAEMVAELLAWSAERPDEVARRRPRICDFDTLLVEHARYRKQHESDAASVQDAKESYELIKAAAAEAGARINFDEPDAVQWSAGDPIDVPVRVPMILHCPVCSTQHIDRGEWATRPHHRHLCEGCGGLFWYTLTNTVGVETLKEPCPNVRAYTDSPRDDVAETHALADRLFQGGLRDDLLSDVSVALRSLAEVNADLRAKLAEASAKGQLVTVTGMALVEPRRLDSLERAEHQESVLRDALDRVLRVFISGPQATEAINELGARSFDMLLGDLRKLARLASWAAGVGHDPVETQESVAHWADTTFGSCTPTRAASRIADELTELAQVLNEFTRPCIVPSADGSRTSLRSYAHRDMTAAERVRVMEEGTDVLITLMRFAATIGESVPACLDRTMQKLRQRKWIADGQGCGYHVKEKP